jgi:hypothetical protein
VSTRSTITATRIVAGRKRRQGFIRRL